APNGDQLEPIAQRGTDSLAVMTPTGSIQEAILNARSVALPTNADDIDLLKHLDLQSLFALPLVGQDKVIGIVLVGHETVHRVSDRERQLAEALVNQAATAIRNAQLYSQTDAALADRVSELSVIEGISRQISGLLDLDTIINDVLDSALSVTGADSAGCALTISQEPVSYVERYPKPSGRPQVPLTLPPANSLPCPVLPT